MPPVSPVRLAAYSAAFFAYIGVYTTYWSAWLAEVGLSAATIGLCISAGAWLRVVLNPAIAHLADRRRQRRRPMLLLLGLGLTLYGLLLWGPREVWFVAPLSVLATLSASAILPLGEAVTLAVVYARKLDYGRLRLWGSLAFIAAGILTGEAVGRFGLPAVPVMVLGMVALALLAVACLPDVRPEPVARRPGEARRLLSHPAFIACIAGASLIQASHAVLYGFATIDWRKAGIADAAIGWLWAEGVLAEVLLFAFSNRVVAWAGIPNLLLLAATAGVVRWGLLGLATSLPVVLLSQPLHALTFGATHLAGMHFIQRACPAHLAATAQSIYSAFAGGIVVGFTALGSGLLYQQAGSAAYLAMAAVALAGGVAGLLLRRLWSGGPLT